MADKLMTTGRLNKKVTIQAYESGADAAGQEQKDWYNWKTVWACVEPMQQSEAFEIDQVTSVRSCKITTRYASGYTPEMRVVYNGRTLEVSGVIDVDERREWLEWTCHERAPNA